MARLPAHQQNAARRIGEFVEHHPTIKIVALSFLMLVGFTLILASFHVQVPKAWLCFAMFFSVAVEFLNLRGSKKRSG